MGGNGIVGPELRRRYAEFVPHRDHPSSPRWAETIAPLAFLALCTACMARPREFCDCGEGVYHLARYGRLRSRGVIGEKDLDAILALIPGYEKMGSRQRVVRLNPAPETGAPPDGQTPVSPGSASG